MEIGKPLILNDIKDIDKLTELQAPCIIVRKVLYKCNCGKCNQLVNRLYRKYLVRG